MRGRLLILGALLGATAAQAQIMRNLTQPSPGQAATASVGNPVYQHEVYRALPAYELGESVRAKIIFARVDLPAGTKLLPIKSNSKLKACAASTIEAFAAKAYLGCFFDDDGDGKFDRVAGNEVQGGKKLDHPGMVKV